LPGARRARIIAEVKSGIFIPPFGELSDPRRVADLAALAEQAGWDGFFIWDHILADPGEPVAEAWTTLAAIAVSTSSIRLGPLVTPLARRRPWTLARQIGNVDQLSGGRLVVGIGLGYDGWGEFSAFGEQTSAQARGRLLDESLDLLLALLRGRDVSHRGPAYTVESTPFLPGPVQRPVPLWGACEWPNRRPLRRATRLQGCFPIFPATGEWPPPPSPAVVAEVRAELRRLGPPDGHDLVVCGATHRMDPAARAAAVAPLPDAGVTWLLERFPPGQSAAEVSTAIRNGPPAPR
jgi:alkanesulfonate monooxygenase SsuD/methylene tetrahydromethanopterin reductase-like flavin-dependent oxidoreductase (luciferase family)